MSINSTTSLALPGLSGYDFSGIINALVQAYRVPEVQMNDQVSELQTKKNDWMELNTRLSAVSTALNTLSDPNTWTAAKAVSSNTSLLTATAGSGAVQGIYNVSVAQMAQAQTVVSSVQAVSGATAADSALATGGSFNITVSGVTKSINVAANSDLQTVATAINNAQAGVNASVVQVSGGYQLAITNNQTGTAAAAVFSDSTLSGTSYNQSVLYELGLVKTDPTTGNPLFDANGNPQLNIAQGAQDASLTINGITGITSASNTITSAIPGVTLNLTQNSGSSVVTVGPDTSVAQNAVQNFVTQYNATMDFIAQKTSYDSTTKQAGDMLGDPLVQIIQSRLRTLVGSTLNNPTSPYQTLASVGITTSSANYGESADLTFNTGAFTQALTANPQSVANLFGAPYNGVTPDTVLTNPSNPQGLANVLGAYLNPMLDYDGTLSQQESSLDSQIKDVQQSISDFEKRVTQYQDMLNARYTALESVLTGLNNQSSWLSNELSAQTKSKNS